MPYHLQGHEEPFRTTVLLSVTTRLLHILEKSHTFLLLTSVKRRQTRKDESRTVKVLRPERKAQKVRSE